jgi:hypothetical protein
VQHHFSRGPLQAFLFACPLLLACEASASPRAKGNKKSAVTPYPHSPGSWPTAPSVDSIQLGLDHGVGHFRPLSITRQRHLVAYQQNLQSSRQNSQSSQQNDRSFLSLSNKPFRLKLSRCCYHGMARSHASLRQVFRQFLSPQLIVFPSLINAFLFQ